MESGALSAALNWSTRAIDSRLILPLHSVRQKESEWQTKSDKLQTKLHYISDVSSRHVKNFFRDFRGYQRIIVIDALISTSKDLLIFSLLLFSSSTFILYMKKFSLLTTGL